METTQHTLCDAAFNFNDGAFLYVNNGTSGAELWQSVGLVVGDEALNQSDSYYQMTVGENRVEEMKKRKRYYEGKNTQSLRELLCC